MNKQDEYKLTIGELMKAYIHAKKTTLFCFFLLVVSGILVSLLYHVEFEAISYVAILWIFIVFVFGIFDFIRFQKKYNALIHLVEEITVNIDNLPESDNLIDDSYKMLLQVSHEDKVNLLSKADSDRKDMLDYYAMWVHQIKTPISAMSLMLQITKAPEKESLKEELFRIEQYVEMVTSYLRLQSSQNDFVIKNYAVNEIVNASVKKFASQFIYRKLSFSMEVEEGMVLTDGKWLSFMIEQILSNSLKYTDKGGITITFKERELSIQDTGIGIAKEDLPRIFEKGYTGYNGRLHQKSSGIGLYLVKQAAEKLSCKIFVESQENKGTTVRILFPVQLNVME